MFKIKDLRDAAVVTLALGTAYGLGVLSCVYWEVKALGEFCNPTKKDDHYEEEES